MSERGVKAFQLLLCSYSHAGGSVLRVDEGKAVLWLEVDLAMLIFKPLYERSCFCLWIDCPNAGKDVRVTFGKNTGAKNFIVSINRHRDL